MSTFLYYDYRSHIGVILEKKNRTAGGKERSSLTEMDRKRESERGWWSDWRKGVQRGEWTLSLSEIYPMPSAPKENITVLGCQVEMDDRDTCSAWDPLCVCVCTRMCVCVCIWVCEKKKEWIPVWNITGTKVMAHCEIIASCPLCARCFPCTHTNTLTRTESHDGGLQWQVKKKMNASPWEVWVAYSCKNEAVICLPGTDLVVEILQIKQCIMGISSSYSIWNVFISCLFFRLRLWKWILLSVQSRWPDIQEHYWKLWNNVW